MLVRLLSVDGLRLDQTLGLDAADLGGRSTRLHLSVDGERHDLDQASGQAVRNYLARRRTGPSSSGPVADGERRLTRFGADYILKRIGRLAGLGVPLSASLLRRS